VKVSNGCRLTEIPAVLKPVSVDKPYVSSGQPTGLRRWYSQSLR